MIDPHFALLMSLEIFSSLILQCNAVQERKV